jgi:hypothetical protein
LAFAAAGVLGFFFVGPSASVGTALRFLLVVSRRGAGSTCTYSMKVVVSSTAGAAAAAVEGAEAWVSGEVEGVRAVPGVEVEGVSRGIRGARRT